MTDAERAAAYDSIRQAQQQLAEDQAAGPDSAVVESAEAAVTQAEQALDTLSLQISGAKTEAGLADQQNQLKLSQAQATLASAQQPPG